MIFHTVWTTVKEMKVRHGFIFRNSVSDTCGYIFPKIVVSRVF